MAGMYCGCVKTDEGRYVGGCTILNPLSGSLDASGDLPLTEMIREFTGVWGDAPPEFTDRKGSIYKIGSGLGLDGYTNRIWTPCCTAVEELCPQSNPNCLTNTGKSVVNGAKYGDGLIVGLDCHPPAPTPDAAINYAQIPACQDSQEGRNCRNKFFYFYPENTKGSNDGQ